MDELVPKDLRPPRETSLALRTTAPARRYFQGAVIHPGNFIILMGGVAASVAAGSGLGLVGLGLIELAYLLAVPRLGAFQRWVDARSARKRKLLRGQTEAEIYRELSPNQQATYDGLRLLRDTIEKNYRRFGRGLPSLASQSLIQIDVLLSSFLRLVDQLNAYRTDLGPTEKLKVSEELASLKRELEAEAQAGRGERLIEIKRRRVKILERRFDRFGKGEENRELISHQLAAIEDLLRLVNEQSMTLRDPADVSVHLDSLLAEVEETESTVKEMEHFLSLREELATMDELGAP